MNFDFFNILVYLLLVVLLAFTVKAYLDMQAIKGHALRSYVLLQEQFALEHNKSRMTTEKLQLAENLQNTLLKRFFKITKDILLLQKLIFEK